MAFTIQIQGDTKDLDSKLDASGQKLDGLQKKATETGGALKKAVDGGSSALGGMKKSIEDATRGFTDFSNAAAAIEHVTHAIVEMADEWTSLGNRVRATGGDVDTVRDQLLGVADATRTGLDETASTYQRLSGSLEELHVSQGETMRITQSINEQFAISGRSTMETSRAMRELTEAFSLGHVDGRIYKSLMTEMPSVMQDLAKSMHVSQAELHKMVEDGKIDAKTLADFYLKSAGDIDDKFKQTVPTISQQMTVLRNDFTAAVGSFNEATGALGSFGERMHEVSVIAKDFASAMETIKKATGTSDKGGEQSAIGHVESDFTPNMIGPNFSMLNPAHLYAEAKAERQAQDAGMQHVVNTWDMQERLGRANNATELWTRIVDEAKTSTHALDDQMEKFLATTKEVGKLTPVTATDIKDLNDEIVNLMNNTGTNTGIFAIADTVMKTFDKTIDHLTSTMKLNPFAQGITDLGSLLGGAVGKDIADKILGPSLDTWDTGKINVVSHALSTEMQLLQQIREPQNTYRQGIHDIDDLLKRHLVTTDQYVAELDKLQAAFAKSSEMADLLYSATARQKHYSPTPQSNEYEAYVKQRDLELDAEDNIANARSRQLEIARAAADAADAAAHARQKFTAEQQFGGLWKFQNEADESSAGAGASLAWHKFSDDAMDAAKVMEKAFTTAFDGLDKALINFVDTGRLELGGLAKDLEHMFLDLAFRQAVGGIGSLVSGSGSSPVGLFAGAASDAPSDGGAPPGWMAARSAPVQVHVNVGADAIGQAMTVPMNQRRIVDVIYKNHSTPMSVRERLRSRG